MVLFANLCISQTTLISPTGNGGFEAGTSFAANGWTVTTGSSTQNQWVCNTGATAGFSGTRAAYVTDNASATPPPHTYTTNLFTTRVSHLYRNITVPAGQTLITLNFDWINYGEGNGNDRLRVWTVPTTYNPTYGTVINASGVNLLQGLNFYDGQPLWTNSGTISLPSSYAGTTFRLVFEWVNNGSFTGDPPAAIDNISVISSVPPAPVNDNCSSAIAITSSMSPSCATAVTGTTLGATQSMVGCAGYADDDVWYKFEAINSTQTITVTTPNSLSNIIFQTFSGNCTGLVNLGCINGTNGFNAETTTLTGLTVGDTYYVRVHSAGNGSGQGNFSICVTTPIMNDNPCNAINLSVDEFCSYTSYSNSGATNTAGVTAPGCADYSGGDVWFSITVPANGSIRVNTQTGVLTDGGMALYSGNCGALTLLECDDDDSQNGAMPMITRSGLTPGSTLYIRIWESGNNNNGTFGICVTSPEVCTAGSGLGTTSLGCPSVIAGGYGYSGSNPDPIYCYSASNCVDLQANYLQLGQSTNYNVEAIPYNPPYQFGCLQNPVSVNVDDVWSPLVNLPFNFCFYGNNYNSCIIGSNGILSFNGANASTSSGYAFSNNLPSSSGALFPNSIYGVYHDIDPSKGGEVGWELITLDTGCRALVASWYNVPMYYDNSILYTGMMVLYENTNVIEVYIREKRIDGGAPWNGGNAIVGVQNATATQSVTAPGRNGLDANWTVINEAWRFVPSGSSITSLKWYEGSGTSGSVIGTADVINVCPTATTTYTAEVTYTLCNGSTLKKTAETTVTVSGGKEWNGSQSVNWENPNNWTPVGVPTTADCVVIPVTPNDPIISGSAYEGNAYNVTIHDNAALTVNTDNNLYVVDEVAINTGGDLVIEDSASLIQTNDVSNTGVAHIIRESEPMYRLDYTYWNSPITLTSAFAVGNLTSGTNLIYRYSPTIAGGNGKWIQMSAAASMNPTYGVIARAPSSFPTTGTKQTFTTTFTGTPNNGTIAMPISKGTDANIGQTVPGNTTIITDADDEWNLIGNPYPSAVDIVSFLNHPSNVPVIDGTIYLWTHNTVPSDATLDPFYGNYTYNYTISDYATVNSAGAVTTAATGGVTPTTYIASGQSFFVSADDSKADGTTDNVTFENSMRVFNNNNVFYRQASGVDANNFDAQNLSKQRVWLNLSNNNGGFSQILVGYVQGQTLGWDRGFDGQALAGNAVKFYSLIQDKKLTIQSRPWPFNQEDVVPLGYNATSQGSYTIGIDHIDASFANQTIYLEDKLLGITHDLKSQAYSFTSDSGNFDNRFVLRYLQNTLRDVDFTVLEQSVFAYTENDIVVKSTIEVIKSVSVFDVQGRQLVTHNNVKTNEFVITNLKPTNSSLILKITLENGAIVTKKVIF